MERTSLNGTWQVDLGGGFVDVEVPGCRETLTTDRRFAGPVTWRREFSCPDLPSGHRLLLCFDAVSYQCELSVNGRPVGTHEGMWDRFTFDVTPFVHPGGGNELALVVRKPGYDPADAFPLRDVFSGFIPDVLCTFGGIWGDVELVEAAGPLPELFTVSTDVQAGRARIGVRVAAPGAEGSASCRAELDLRVLLEGREIFASHRPFEAGPGTTAVTEQLPLDGLRLWSPGRPVRYDVEAVVRSPAGGNALRRRIGLREVRVEGERMLLNGEPLHLRGALHWGYYPDRVIPRPSREEIRGELAGLRAMGFNAVKFCLWVPRDEFLGICDEEGFLAWLELPLWLPRVTPALESRMRREYPRIVEQAAQHPCLVACSLGCELGAEVTGRVLGPLARQVREIAGGVPVCDNSGSGECYGGLAEDFSDYYDYHFYADDQYLEPLMEAFTPRWRPARPWLFGEFADADTWRVVRSAGSSPWWSGGDAGANPIAGLKPDFRLHLQPERLGAPGMKDRPGLADPSGALALASREHAILHRKLTLESTRACSQVKGYNVTAIRDVPLATSGLFDDAMQPKFRAEELLPFNGGLVLVPRWDLARAWVNGDRVREPDRYNHRAGEPFALRIVASNWLSLISGGAWSWRIVDDAGGLLAEGFGTLARPLLHGETRELFRISADLPGDRGKDGQSALRLTVHASLEHEAGRADNRWPLFVWPRSPGTFTGARVALHDPLGILEPLRERCGASDFGAGSGRGCIVAASAFDDRLEEHVRRGGAALLVQRGPGRFPHARVAFWREGFAVFEDHPVARAIPRGEFRELALYGMATGTALQWIEPGGPVRSVQPIISRIDAREFVAQHYAVELGYGRGALIVTTLRLEGGAGTQPTGLAANSAALHLVDRMLCRLRDR